MKHSLVTCLVTAFHVLRASVVFLKLDRVTEILFYYQEMIKSERDNPQCEAHWPTKLFLDVLPSFSADVTIHVTWMFL